MPGIKLKLTHLIKEIPIHPKQSKNKCKRNEVLKNFFKSIYANVKFPYVNNFSLIGKEIKNKEDVSIAPVSDSTNNKHTKPFLSPWEFMSAKELFLKIENNPKRTTNASVRSKPNLLTHAIRIAFVN